MGFGKEMGSFARENPWITYMIIGAAVAGGVAIFSKDGESSDDKAATQPVPLVQRADVGFGPGKESYVEVGGIKYFSEVNGVELETRKDLGDMLRQTYVRE